MRIRQLDLERFGHFTGHSIDFGDAGTGPDFHIIHGRNEAGKTTTMEAFLRLLYGFPHVEPYAFRHQRANLRVSALLEIDGEAPRRFTRLPLRSGALQDHAGTPLPETALAAHLGGLTLEDYRQLLCLDDATIEQGGEEIANARGKVGHLLFSAMSGVANLSGVLDTVRAEADALFRPRASKTELAALKRDLAAVEKQIREQDVTIGTWRRLKQALETAAAQESDARETRDALRARAARIEAKSRALPLLAALEQTEAAIAPHTDLPARLDFTPESLVALLTDQTRAQSEAGRLEAEARRLAALREAVTRAPQALGLMAELDTLDDLRSRDATARLDLPRRRAALDEAEQDMARAMADLGATGSDPLDLVLSPADLARLETARDTLRDMRRTLAREKAEVEEHRHRHDGARRDLDRLTGAGPETAGLSELLGRAGADTLAVAHAAARTAQDEARARLDSACEGLPDPLPDCPLAMTDLEHLAAAHGDLAGRIERGRDALNAHLGEAALLQGRIDRATGSAGFVGDTEAQALRRERDRLWSVHRAAPGPATADAFETAMRQVDDSLDARLAHSRELGELRQNEQALGDARRRAETAKAQLDALTAEQAAVQARLDDAARATGLATPVIPATLLANAARLETAHGAVRHLRRVTAHHAPVLERAARLQAALAPLVALDAPDFDAALAAARALAETGRAHAAAVAAAQQALDAAARDLAQRRDRLSQAQAAAQRATDHWHETVGALLANRVTPDIAENSLGPLRDLRELAAGRDAAARRIAAMDRDQRDFADRIAALATAQGLSADAPAPQTFGHLRALAGAAQKAETEHAELSARIADSERDRAAALSRLADIAKRVQTLARLFPDRVPIDTLDDLRAATALTAELNANRARCRDLEQRLLAELGEADPGAARAALANDTPAALDAAAATLAQDQARAEAALTRATEARTAAREALNAVTGDDDIAALIQRKATLELQIEQAALRHLELDLGHRLAEEAIRRYRNTHRSGMMLATERGFATLTDGAYPRLHSETENGSETLRAIGADGMAKQAAALSKGTRFQLYLALRAAAHEQLGAQGLHLPFFCDDIFETFDEERTRAACRVMERIATRGQAIYLTHHRHVVDIAREVCASPPGIHRMR